jgi:4-amino-4-deoxy-L-arabinose transferase-like glycosyltransferase
VLGLVLIFGVRASYAWLVPPHPGKALNVDRWGTIARNLIEGKGYVYPYYLDQTGEPVAPNAQRGPIPVLFFALMFKIFGVSVAPIMIAQWLLDCGTGLLLYLIAIEIFDDRSIALLALVLFALYIPEVTYTTQAYSEPLFTFILASFVFLFLKALAKPSAVRMVVPGVLLGLGSLSQPILLLFPSVILVSLVILYRNLVRALSYSLVLVLAFSLVLSPWIIRNYVEFRAFLPGTTLLGFNLIVDHYNIEQDNFIQGIGWKEGVDKEVATVTEQLLARNGQTSVGRSPVELERVRLVEALRLISKRPDRYISLCFHRFLRLWFNVGYGAPPSILSYLILAANAILLGLALIRLLVFRGPWIRTAWPILALICYFTVSYTAIHAQIRYILPVIPYVVLIASSSVFCFRPMLDWTVQTNH